MKNVSLSLYGFHQRDYLDDAPNAATFEAQGIWESVTQVSEYLPFKELKTLKSQLISYQYDKEIDDYQYQPQREEVLKTEWLTQNGRPIEFTPILTQSGFKLGGTLQPFRLHDTYCLDITITPEVGEIEIEFRQIAAFKPQVLINNITADLGKVLTLYGECDEESQLSLNEAERWAIALCANSPLEPQFLSEIKLFNCPCFLFESDDVTIIIALSQPNQFDSQQANSDYDWLRDLFWTQKKILATYREAHKSYQEARKIYGGLEKTMDRLDEIVKQPFSQRLNSLEILVKDIPQKLLYYNRFLRDLEVHHNTINDNLDNFKTCLSHLLKYKNNELVFWSTLSHKKYPQYLRQIKTHLAYLEPSKDLLFSDLITTIRTTTEIEKAKSNQDVQDNLQALGVGLTLGGVAAGRSGLLTEPWSWKGETVELELPFPPFLVAMFLGLGFAILGYLGTRCLIKRKRSPTPKSRKMDESGEATHV
ncbi:MAG: hypothetical protein JJU32_19900 [Phormidium sp. BM_Day4_Bin.17]|nr:hypothetical protein [Phormidium sp. BM_Day4_Bin.17]UCJ11585.1 MAG: hypothetical protein JWS08_17815 [Phormidium sp. PBR-2020]